MFKQFRDTQLTNVGFNVSNKAATGKTQYKITRAVSTDTDLSGYKIDDIKNLSKLPDELDSGTITDYNAAGTDTNVSIIRINFDNSHFTNGYGIRAVALYAQEEGSTTEFLHSVTVSDSEIIIPEVSGNVYDGFTLNMSIFTGSNSSISVDIADENNATVKYVNDEVATASVNANKYTDAKADELQKKIDVKADRDNFESAVSNINSNISNNADLINGLKNSSLQFKGSLTSDDDVNNISNGIYSLFGVHPKNMPNDFTQSWGAYGTLIQYGGNNYYMQIVSSVIWNPDDFENEDGNKNVIMYRTDIDGWHDWKTIATKDNLDDSVLFNNLGRVDSGEQYNPANGDNVKQGYCYVDANVTNLPNTTNGILIVFGKNGRYLNPEILIDDNSMWFRMIDYAWQWPQPKDWQRIITDNDLANLQNQINDKANQDEVKSALNNVNSNIDNVSNDVKDLSDNSYKFRGALPTWVNNLDDFMKLPDSIYLCWDSNNRAVINPSSGDTWGVVTKQSYSVTFHSTLTNNFYVAMKYSNEWHWSKLGGVEQLLNFVNSNFAKNDDLKSSVNNINANIQSKSDKTFVDRLNASALKKQDYVFSPQTNQNILDVFSMSDGYYLCQNVNYGGYSLDGFSGTGIIEKNSFQDENGNMINVVVNLYDTVNNIKWFNAWYHDGGWRQFKKLGG